MDCTNISILSENIDNVKPNENKRPLFTYTKCLLPLHKEKHSINSVFFKIYICINMLNFLFFIILSAKIFVVEALLTTYCHNMLDVLSIPTLSGLLLNS